MGKRVSEVGKYYRGQALIWAVLQRLPGRIRELDWEWAKGSVIFSVGMGLAGLFGFAFSAVVARALSPGEYGAFQYAIAVASVVSLATQPFGQHVIARFVGRYREKYERLALILNSSWAILSVLTLITLLLAGPILIRAATQNIFGIIVVFLGITTFYAYWGLARGFLAPGNLTIAYLGGNLAQLILVCISLYLFNMRSSLFVLVIYGLCFAIPPVLLQILRPLPVSFKIYPTRKTVAIKLLKFAVPIWISHGGYLLSQTIDILLLAQFWGTPAVGLYSVLKTLAAASLYLPTSVATFLMPKAAGSHPQTHRKLLTRGLILSLGFCIAVLALYLLFGGWLVTLLFGNEYTFRTDAAIVLALAMIMQAVHSIATAVLVGRGQPAFETISRVAAVCSAIIVGWFMIPIYGILGAAMVALAGPLSALLAYALLVLVKNPVSFQ